MEYYKAYNERYKEIHSQNFCWESSHPTKEIDSWINYYNIPPKADILDIGCGEGRDSFHLLNSGFNVTGIDVAEEAILYCRKKENYQDHFKQWDIIEKPYSMLFNYVYSISTLHMLVLDTDRTCFLKNIYTSLKSGGILLLLNMGNGIDERGTNIDDAFTLAERTHMESGRKVKVASTSCRIVNEEKHQQELVSAGFEIESYKYVETENYGTCSAVYLRKP